MKAYFFVVFLTFTLISVGQEKKTELIPYRKGNIWGYCDSSKKIKIPIKFDEAFPFGYSSHCCYYEDYAKVKFHGQYYVVDRKGRLEKETIFIARDKDINPPPAIEEMVMSYSDKMEKTGEVTSNGETIIPANKYKSISVLDGYNPFFIVSDSNNLYGVIDRNQNIILPLNYHDLFYFSLEEYYDSAKRKLITPVYFVFREPHAKKRIISLYKDSTLNQITATYCHKLNNYIAIGEPGKTLTENIEWGIVDRNLNLLVQPKYAQITNEDQSGIFLVRIYNYDKSGERLEDKIGYINKIGKEFFE